MSEPQVHQTKTNAPVMGVVVRDAVSEAAIAALTGASPLQAFLAAGTRFTLGLLPSAAMEIAQARATAESHRRAREQATLTAAYVLSGDRNEEFQSRINAAERAPFVSSALEAGGRSAYPERIYALAEALKSGILADDDDLVDVEQAVITALDALERPHVRVLDVLAVRTDSRILETQRLTRQDLLERLPNLRPILTKVTADLVAAGLLVGSSSARAGGVIRASDVQMSEWSMSDFGLDCLVRLQRMAPS